MTWWLTAGELTMIVACEGSEHRLRWRDGELRLLDHPELEAELAMVALGGAEPACVSHYRLWEDGLSDGGFLAEWVDEARLNASWFSWLAMALERMRSEGFHEFLRGLPPARAQRMGEFLHRFSVPWIDRAAAGVSHSVGDGDGVVCPLAPALLCDAVSQRLRRAFVDSVGGRQLAVGAAALVPLSIAVSRSRSRSSVAGSTAAVDPGDPEQADGGPSITGSLSGPGRGITIGVHRSWLHRVWAAGAPVIEGRLVLDLQAVDPIDPHPGRDRTEQEVAAVAALVTWEPDRIGVLQPRIERRPVRFAERRWRIEH
ncbi:MAG: hypothetical protein ACR2QK_23305 [Acidimicrobiales bacterium]